MSTSDLYLTIPPRFKEPISGWIIVTGNPVSGVEFYGPFDTSQDATDRAEWLGFDQYWVACIYTPYAPGDKQ